MMSPFEEQHSAQNRIDGIRHVLGAIIRPCGKGEVNGLRQISGVFDASGRLVNEAQVLGRPGLLSLRGDCPKTDDLPVRKGRWLYGGIGYKHFGHALIFSTARLWALDEIGPTLDGIIFIQRGVGNPLQAEVPGHLRKILETLAVSCPVVMVGEAEIVEDLFVPEQGISTELAFFPGTQKYRSYIRKAISRIKPSPRSNRKVYISRTKLGLHKPGLVFEDRIERLLGQEEYLVFHPQEHSLEEQIAIYRGASHIIGIDGSAMHVAAFAANKDAKIAVLGRRPLFPKSFANQISAFSGADPYPFSAYDRIYAPAANFTDGALWFRALCEVDFPLLEQMLTSAGFIAPKEGWQSPTPRGIQRRLGRASKAGDTKFVLVPEKFKAIPPGIPFLQDQSANIMKKLASYRQGPSQQPRHPPITFHLSSDNDLDLNSFSARNAALGWISSALKGLGAVCKYFAPGTSPEVTGHNDVILRIAQKRLEDPIPGVPNLVWAIAPLHLASVALLGRYNRVFVSSQLVARRLRKAKVDASFLPLPTEDDRFHPDLSIKGAERNPICFIGNRNAQNNHWIVHAAIELGFDLRLWGAGWEAVARPGQWQGNTPSSFEVAQIYASSDIVLNSQMPALGATGFIGNAVLGGLASGAAVISSEISGFDLAGFPEFFQVNTSSELHDAIRHLSSLGSPSKEVRLDRYKRAVKYASANDHAMILMECANELLARNADDGQDSLVKLSQLNDLDTRHPSMIKNAVEILQRFGKLSEADVECWSAAVQKLEGNCSDSRFPTNDLIHCLSHDVRETRALTASGSGLDSGAKQEKLASRSRRFLEFIQDGTSVFAPAGVIPRGLEDAALAKVVEALPLLGSADPDFQRSNLKKHLRLSPLEKEVKLARPLGIFLHLYYDDLAPIFVETLSRVNAPYKLYVSTDTAKKAKRMNAYFPSAEVRVFENRGRDVYPKLYGFADTYGDHDLILHLHGKKSPQFGATDAWLTHINEALVGSSGEINRILSLFHDFPKLGLLAPVVPKHVLKAAHWGANRAIATELAARMGLKEPLPSDGQLRFPTGSMFWARSAAIQPLIELALPPAAFPPEQGQKDGTLAHAIERLLGVTCTWTGHHFLSVAGVESRLYPKFVSKGRTKEDIERLFS